jgi:parallel beta-helix repeat protein
MEAIRVHYLDLVKKRILTIMIIFSFIFGGFIQLDLFIFKTAKGDSGAPPINGTTFETWYVEGQILRDFEWINTSDIQINDSASMNWNNIFAEVNGDIIVNSSSYLNLTNCSITLNGNLIINGNVTFHNVTLKMNCTYDGQYYIEVKTGGAFNIFDNDNNNFTTYDSSIIQNGSSQYHFCFWVNKNSKLRFFNSRLFMCGFEWSKDRKNAGLWINTDNSIIKNNLISEATTGIVIYNVNNSIIKGNIIKNIKGKKDLGHRGVGIYLESSNQNKIINNTITLITGSRGKPGFSGGRGGIASGIEVYSSSTNFIYNNTIFEIVGGIGGPGQGTSGNDGGTGGIGAGIYLKSSSNLNLTSNIIYNIFGGRGGKATRVGSGGSGGIGAGIFFKNSISNNLTSNNITSIEGGIRGSGGTQPNESPSNGANQHGFGIYIDHDSFPNKIDITNYNDNNNIIYKYNKTNFKIKNYKLKANSNPTNLGKIVLIQCSNVSIIQNNIVNFTGESGETGQKSNGDPGKMGSAVYLHSCSNITVLNNYISSINGGKGGTGGIGNSGGSGGNGVGIYIYNTSKINISMNTITNIYGGKGGTGGYTGTSGNRGGHSGSGIGIFLDFSQRNYIFENNISNINGNAGGEGHYGGVGGNGGSAFGICLFKSFQNNLSRNSIINVYGGMGARNGWNQYFLPCSNGGTASGIFLQNSNKNNVSKHTISYMTGGTAGTHWSGKKGIPGIGIGIQLFTDNQNNFINDSNFSKNDFGIKIESSNNNILTNNSINANEVGIFTSSSINVILINCSIIFNLKDDINITDHSNITTINSSFENINISDIDSLLIVQWYLSIAVLNKSLFTIKNATIDIKNLKNNYKKLYTNKYGNVKWIICTEYIQNSTERINFTPHLVHGYKMNIGTYKKLLIMNISRNIDLILVNSSGPILTDCQVDPPFGYTANIFNYTVTYNDANNDPPSFMIVSIDGHNYSMMEVDSNDLTFADGKEYYYKIKLIRGNHTFRFFTSDGINNYSSSIEKKPNLYNSPPIISFKNITNAIEDELFFIDFNATDNDGDNITWTLTSNGSWLKINNSNGELEGYPTNSDVGKYWVNITVMDGYNGTDYLNFTLIVNNTNDPPIINTSDITVTDEDVPYNVIYSATDIDKGDTVTWVFNSNASWLFWGSLNHTIYGTPKNNDVGKYWVRINASDKYGGFDEHFFILSVVNTNDPPVIITEDKTSVFEDEYYEIQYKAIDIDLNDNLTWTFETNASWLMWDLLNHTLNGTPTNDDVGFYSIKLNVSDEYGGFDEHFFILEVINMNDFPKILTEDILIAYEDELYKVNYTAVEVDIGDKSYWSYSSNAKWLNWDSANLTLFGIPRNEDVEIEFWVQIDVYDRNGGSDVHYFYITVINTNDKPEILNQDNTIAIEDEFYESGYSAIDIDKNDLLKWKFDSNAKWLNWEKQFHILYGTPRNNDIGEYWVNIIVTDLSGEYDEHNFTLKVTNVNDPPTINNAPKKLSINATYETIVDFTPFIMDIDNETYELKILINSLFIITDNLKLIFNYPDSLTHDRIKLIVTDGLNLSEAHYIYITINDINPPIIINNSPIGIDVPISINISITFNEPMMQSSVEKAFSIIPSVEGDFIWMDNTTIFKPLLNLFPNTTYIIHIKNIATDLSENSLKNKYSWNFTTMIKKIKNVDTDGDGILDIYDEDDDNDNILDINEYKLGTNSLLNDTDGDSYTDNEDAFPLDSTKWDEETKEQKDKKKLDNSWIWILLIMIVIITVVCLILIIKTKKKKIRKEKEVIEEKLEPKLVVENNKNMHMQQIESKTNQLYQTIQQSFCSKCGLKLSYNSENNSYYCSYCQKRNDPKYF